MLLCLYLRLGAADVVVVEMERGGLVLHRPVGAIGAAGSFVIYHHVEETLKRPE